MRAKHLIAGLIMIVVGMMIQQCTSELAEATVINLPTVQCESCSETIKTALKKVEGIQAVSIDLEVKTARVTFFQSKVSVNDIENVIAHAGYQANKTSADPNSYDTLPDCCKLPSGGSDSSTEA